MTNNSSQGKKGQQLTRKTSSKEAVSENLTGKTPRSLAKQSSGSQLKRSTRSNPSTVKQEEACSQSEDDNMNVDAGSTQPESNGDALMDEERNPFDPMDKMKTQLYSTQKDTEALCTKVESLLQAIRESGLPRNYLPPLGTMKPDQILVLLDGDGCIFRNDLLKMGRKGGREAARRLAEGIYSAVEASFNSPYRDHQLSVIIKGALDFK
ncbi:hypothetical protein NMY22_g8103 [Coprinellus aureogranulatus]|nr:hypothetical protein NMY22_g8103 [Coprinellus aureogranulatus]